MEIDPNEIPVGQFCSMPTKYNKEIEDGYGNKVPGVTCSFCKYMDLNIFSGLENSHLNPPLCWVCSYKQEVLVEKELTTRKLPIKICGIKDQKIPEELLSLTFDDIENKLEEEITEINKRLEEYQNVT